MVKMEEIVSLAELGGNHAVDVDPITNLHSDCHGEPPRAQPRIRSSSKNIPGRNGILVRIIYATVTFKYSLVNMVIWLKHQNKMHDMLSPWKRVYITKKSRHW